MANVNTDRVIMAALAVILPGYPSPNTNLATENGNIVVQSEYAISQGTFPAVHIEVGPQRHQLVTSLGYGGTAKFDVSYFDRWDEQATTIDTIRTQIDADLTVMMGNVQRNPSLACDINDGNGLQAHATSVPIIDLSPYKGEIDKDTVPGMTLVKRVMTVTVNILPYDA